MNLQIQGCIVGSFFDRKSGTSNLLGQGGGLSQVCLGFTVAEKHPCWGNSLIMSIRRGVAGFFLENY